MELPDIYGYPLEDALRKLNKAGITDYNIKVTSSPRVTLESYDNTFRVAAFRKDKTGKIEIIICKPL